MTEAIPRDVMDAIEGYRENYIESQPKTRKELFIMLKEKGKERREEIRSLKGENASISPLKPDEVAQIIFDNCHTAIIGNSDANAPLGVYDPEKGVYVFEERFLSQLINAVELKSAERQIKDVRSKLIYFCSLHGHEKETNQDKRYMLFNNGILDRKTRELTPFTPEYIATANIATDYVEGAEEPDFPDWSFSGWIDEIAQGDAKRKELIWQVFATVINPKMSKDSCLFLYDEGIGRTGKGTFQELLISFVGRENTATIRLEDFEKRFMLAPAVGKMLIIGDDNDPDVYIKSSANFKSAITGDPVLIEQKHQPVFQSRLNAFIVQSMNGAPRFKDLTGGLTRRIRGLKFTHGYTPQTENKRVKEEYVKDPRLLEYIASKASKMEFESLVITQDTLDLIGDIKSNDPVYTYATERFPIFKSNRLPTRFIFDDYKAWCVEQNTPTRMSQKKFTTELQRHIGTKYSYHDVPQRVSVEHFSPEDVEHYEMLADSVNIKYWNREDFKAESFRSRVHRCFVKRDNN